MTWWCSVAPRTLNDPRDLVSPSPELRQPLLCNGPHPDGPSDEMAVAAGEFMFCCTASGGICDTKPHSRRTIARLPGCPGQESVQVFLATLPCSTQASRVRCRSYTMKLLRGQCQDESQRLDLETNESDEP